MSERKRKKEEHEEGAPEWMTTFSDMTTLLLAFFILLFSYSVIDVVKFQQIVSSMQTTFLGQESILDSPDEIPQDELPEDDTIESIEIMQAIESIIADQGLEDMMEVRIEPRGIVLEISDRVLFDSGRADLRPESLEVLDLIRDNIIAEVDSQILVEGHTDNIPINTAIFPSNWELSTARASRVIRYFAQAGVKPDERFVAIGYGEFHPIASNETFEGRQKNRRVNIVFPTIEHSPVDTFEDVEE